MPSTPTYNPKLGRVTPGGPSLLDALTSLPDVLERFPTNQAASDDALRRRFQADSELPAVPPPPRLPTIAPWRPEGSIGDRLAEQGGSDTESSGLGRFDVSGSPDWAAERLAFLGRGSSPEIGMMADAAEARNAIDENAATQRPDLFAAMQNELALSALRSARARADQQIELADPAYQRAQRGLDAVADAETYLDPTISRARERETTDAVGRQTAFRELAIRLGVDPRVLAQEALEFERKKSLAEISASGRNPLGALLGGRGGGNAAATPAASSNLDSNEIRRRVLARGGSDEDVQRIIAEAQARGVLR